MEDEIYSILGRTNLDNMKEGNALRRKIIESNVHPEWDLSKETKRYDADIMILKLESKVNFNRFIKPICLPSGDDLVYGVRGIVAGYGLTETSSKLQFSAHSTIHSNCLLLDRRTVRTPSYIVIPTVTQEKCESNHQAFKNMISDRTFCGGLEEVVACNGDSGSSFIVPECSSTSQWKVLGIVSAGIKDFINDRCHVSYYAVFTSVGNFLPWIATIVGGLQTTEGKWVELKVRHL
jgi:Trypsin